METSADIARLMFLNIDYKNMWMIYMILFQKISMLCHLLKNYKLRTIM